LAQTEEIVLTRSRGRRAAACTLLLLSCLFPATARAAERVRIEVDGLDRDLRRNVTASLSLEEARKDKDLTEERIRRLHAKGEDEIKTALQPFGYYRPDVKATLSREGDAWVARYEVDQGPPLHVTNLDVRVEGAGSDDPWFRQDVQEFPLQPGETLYHPDYEAGKQSLVDHAATNGYLDADFQTNEIRVDLDAYTADVVVHFTTGPRYRFGPVTFEQNFLDPDLLRGYVTFKEGEYLDVDELLEMQNALSDSPYFQRVEVLTRRDLAQGDAVPIVVNLTPSKHQRWSGGAGYGTDTGPRGTVALELRRINRKGHRGNVEVRGSQIEQSLKAQYQIPGAFPRTDVLTFSLGYSDIHTDTSESKSSLVGVGRTQARGTWREAIALNLQREDFEVGLDKGRSDLLIPQATWTRVRADDRISATRGDRVEFTLRGADESVLSNASFLQVSAQGKLIHSFADRFRFITRLQVGHTETDQIRELPPSIRFFAGGDQSVRGYGYQQLGPLDEAGNVIGGEDLLTGSVELEYRFLEKWLFLEKWGVAVFYDTGNAMRSFSGSLEEGAGVGLRWVSPIGPIRADAAFALTEPGTPVRFHLTVGPDL
jgi:translocation and assembly module TamA